MQIPTTMMVGVIMMKSLVALMNSMLMMYQMIQMEMEFVIQKMKIVHHWVLFLM